MDVSAEPELDTIELTSNDFENDLLGASKPANKVVVVEEGMFSDK